MNLLLFQTGPRDDSSDEDEPTTTRPAPAREAKENPQQKQANPQQKKRGQAQSTISIKLKLCEVALDDIIVTQAPVQPRLTQTNADGRWIFVPATEFKANGIAGWTGKILKVEKRAPHLTTVQMHDGKQYWEFPYVSEHFKTLS